MRSTSSLALRLLSLFQLYHSRGRRASALGDTMAKAGTQTISTIITPVVKKWLAESDRSMTSFSEGGGRIWSVSWSFSRETGEGSDRSFSLFKSILIGKKLF